MKNPPKDTWTRILASTAPTPHWHSASSQNENAPEEAQVVERLERKTGFSPTSRFRVGRDQRSRLAKRAADGGEGRSAKPTEASIGAVAASRERLGA